MGTRVGEVMTWGSGLAGQLGLGSVVAAATPTRVGGLPSLVKKVVAGTYVTAVADAEDHIYIWGSKGSGMFAPTPRLVELPKV